jgi:hypothetical protein
MNLTIDCKNKTLVLNESVLVSDLMDFIRRNAYWDWTITYKK